MRIYLDHNATSPLHPEVASLVSRLLTEEFGNPSSVHTFGQRAKAVLDEARSHVAALIGAEPGDVVFTSGGTEADNFAIRGAAEALEPTGRRHLIASSIEHEAVLTTIKALEKRGWSATLLPVGQSGIVEPDALGAAMRDDTALVSVMHANNEIGTIQPVRELAAVAHARGALFHTDAVQSVGKIPVSVRELGVDLLSLAGHKFNGPKGTGALWLKRGTRLTATMTGGRQERNRRAGTENVPALAGLGLACRIVGEKVVHLRSAAPSYGGQPPTVEMALLRDRLESGVLASVPDTAVNGARDRRVPNTTNISFEGIEAESLLIALDLEGVAVSTGSACSSGSLEPSHVIKAMGLPHHRGTSSIRFSFGLGNTGEEVDFVVARLPALVEKLRALTGRARRA
ncbi:MAG TPA: cysteine desulfurase family protein [Vicinamibacterales bacterium]|nr:cysteine desulfurase family protein [Vicinamibacterales bacterium]